jgi:hypothetical protein
MHDMNVGWRGARASGLAGRLTQVVGGLMLGPLLALVLISCGGGASVASNDPNNGGVGSGGTGSYTNGPVGGLGSIIVNGVRYDVSQAAVTGEDDTGASVDLAASDVSLGMLVEVTGSALVDNGTGVLPSATASAVRVGRSLVGPISAINTSQGTLTILGQTVRYDSSTVQPVSLSVNDVVAVYGQLDGSGAYVATRIDLPASVPAHYLIVGQVSSITSDSLFMGSSGNLQIVYTPLGTLPDGSYPGRRLRVWFSLVGGAWTASRVVVDSALADDRSEASLDGRVTQVLDAQGRIRVEDRLVSVSGLSGMGALAVGQRVRVEGSLQSGVLVADEVLTGTDLDDEDNGYELHGAVTLFDAGTSSFTVRGVPVFYGSAAVSGGTLQNDACVEVHGNTYNASRQLIATEIEFEGDCD